MRERLTFAFVLLTLAILAGALFVTGRGMSAGLRDHTADDLRREAVTVRLTLEQRVEAGGVVDPTFLAALVPPQGMLRYEPAEGGAVAAEGAEFAGDSYPEDRRSTVIDAGGGELTVTEAGDIVQDVATAGRRSSYLLLLLGAALAGLFGWLAARRFAAPFRQLAEAADLLGRGRFDLELPRSRMPEVVAVSQALHGAAGRLQERLSREQEFAQHASHVLRTPLTGLRMELEELSLRDDVPTDVRETVCRSLDRIDSMNVVAGELVQLSRRGALVAGSEVSLRDLATQQAQRWADTLAEHDRPLTAAVEGNLETTYTPGPVEHILDLLLVDVLRRGTGSVRMVFEADGDDNLKIRLTSAGEHKTARGSNIIEVPITQARAVTTALGGRLAGTDPVEGFEILLPRR